MYLAPVHMCIVFGVDDVIDDVMTSQKRSKIKIAITPLLFKLQRRSKAQIVGLTQGRLAALINFQ